MNTHFLNNAVQNITLQVFYLLYARTHKYKYINFHFLSLMLTIIGKITIFRMKYEYNASVTISYHIYSFFFFPMFRLIYTCFIYFYLYFLICDFILNIHMYIIYIERGRKRIGKYTIDRNILLVNLHSLITFMF